MMDCLTICTSSCVSHVVKSFRKIGLWKGENNFQRALNIFCLKSIIYLALLDYDAFR